jgi:hypothetical protein
MIRRSEGPMPAGETMRRIHLSLLIGAALALPIAAYAADGSQTRTNSTLTQDAKSAGRTIKKDAKSFGIAVKHTAIKIGHAARDFGRNVAAATKKGAKEVTAKVKD